MGGYSDEGRKMLLQVSPLVVQAHNVGTRLCSLVSQFSETDNLMFLLQVPRKNVFIKELSKKFLIVMVGIAEAQCAARQ